MNWSNPIPADPANAHTVPTGPIVYRARVVAADGSSRPVPRFWAEDKEGVLAIGETEVGRARFLEMTHSMRGLNYGRGSSSGWHYKWWFGYRDCTVERTVYEWIDLRPAVEALSARAGRPVTVGHVTEAAELLLIYRYRSTFGDLPPCNQSDPHFNAVSKWMREELKITPRYDAAGRLNVPLLDLPGVGAISWEDAVAASGEKAVAMSAEQPDDE